MKRFSAILVLSIFSLGTIFAQSATPPRRVIEVPQDLVAKPSGSAVEAPPISDKSEKSDVEWVKKYAETITAGDLEAHLNFIASDELEGRETGTHGQRVAAKYLATQFQRLGLQPGNNGSWFQYYDLNTVEIESSSLTVVGKETFQPIKDYIYYNKSPLANGMEGDLVFAGYGISDPQYDNLDGLSLKGKIALIFASEPVVEGKSLVTGTDSKSEWTKDSGKKIGALQAKGATGIVTIIDNETFDKVASSPWLSHRMTGRSQSLAYKDEGGDGQIPLILIPERLADLIFKKGKTSCAAQRDWLNKAAKCKPLNLSKAHLKLTVDGKKETIQASNVLGFIEGTDLKDEIVILTAHYDHLGIHDGVIFNGADDDGTGTVALLELAEAFAKAMKEGHRPRRSILFMPVSGEEKGLLGSEFYSDHPVYPLEKTVCDLNIDMIGRVDDAHKDAEDYIYIIGSNMLSSELHDASVRANENVTKIDLDYAFNSADDPNRFYYRSDHYNFAKHDIPVIFYFSGVHADYHKATDTVEKILFEKAAKVTRLVFATAWDAANRDKRYVIDRKSDFEDK